jgi:hypothetical protein
VKKETMTKVTGEALISELLTDAETFTEKHGPYALLQEYFHGFSLETLRPLLRHTDPAIRRVGAFITSELGSKGLHLVDDIVPLASSDDPRLVYDAMVAITSFSDGLGSAFEYVLRNLAHVDSGIRRLCMQMTAGVSVTTLNVASQSFSQENPIDREHLTGISLLLQPAVNPDQIRRLLVDPSPLLRRYAAVAARRAITKAPELITEASLNEDADVKRFAYDELNPPAIDSVVPRLPTAQKDL